ncbi:MAG TPA: hypothetical protein ENJ18_17465, partial [Nannocystis exedens]|nr:hypothetical protein [Nannocystis exedens]
CVGEPPPPEILQAPAVKSMIGRDRQLAALRSVHARVLESGRPCVACISGESGLGKSALLQGFSSEVQRSHNARVLAGRCYTSESVPFRALDPLIDGLTRVLVELPPEEAAALVPAESWALVRLFPVLGRIAAFAEGGDPRARSTDAAEIQRQAIAALRCLLRDLCALRPLLMVIDDLQWSDDDSAVLLREILAAPDAPPVLVVVGIRAGRVAGNTVLESLKELTDGPAVEQIKLGPLTADEARALVISLSGVAVDDERLDPLVREAAGVPLFLVELARHLASEGGATEMVALDDLIRARLAGLPESARGLLEVLAIAGRPLSPSVVVRAAGIGAKARSMIPRLKAAHLLCERSIGRVAEIEIFHERIRNELVSGISQLRRPPIHRALALALAKEGAAASLLALHFRAGGLRPLALQYTLEAAEAAMSEFAFRRAVSFFISAVDLAEVGPELRGIHRRLAEALGYLGLASEAAEHYMAAAEGAEVEEGIALRREAAVTLLRCGEIERGSAAMRGVLREVKESWPRGSTGAAFALKAERLRLRLRGYSFTLCEPGSLSAGTCEHLATLSAASEGLAASDPLLAMVFQTRFLRRALATGDPTYVAPALAGEAAFRSHVGDGAKVTDLLEDSRQLLSRCTSDRPVEAWRLCSSVVAFGRGQWAECIEHIDAARALKLRHQGAAYISMMCGVFELHSLFYLGRLRELKVRRDACLTAADEGRDLCASTTLRVGMQVFALLATDDWEQARSEVWGAVGSWPAGTFTIQRAWAFLAMRAIDLYADDPEVAWAHLEAAWPEYRRNIGFSGCYLRTMGRFWRAHTALAAGVGGKRGLLAVAASELHDLTGERAEWVEPFAGLLRGAVDLAYGDDLRAAQAYREAMEGFAVRGMVLWSAAAQRRLGELLAGDEGRSLVGEADALARSVGVLRPARLFATLAPPMR